MYHTHRCVLRNLLAAMWADSRMPAMNIARERSSANAAVEYRATSDGDLSSDMLLLCGELAVAQRSLLSGDGKLQLRSIQDGTLFTIGVAAGFWRPYAAFLDKRLILTGVNGMMCPGIPGIPPSALRISRHRCTCAHTSYAIVLMRNTDIRSVCNPTDRRTNLGAYRLFSADMYCSPANT